MLFTMKKNQKRKSGKILVLTIACDEVFYKRPVQKNFDSGKAVVVSVVLGCNFGAPELKVGHKSSTSYWSGV